MKILAAGVQCTELILLVIGQKVWYDLHICVLSVVVWHATTASTGSTKQNGDFTGAEWAQCVFWFQEAKSVIQFQEIFLRHMRYVMCIVILLKECVVLVTQRKIAGQMWVRKEWTRWRCVSLKVLGQFTSIFSCRHTRISKRLDGGMAELSKLHGFLNNLT